MGTFGDGRGDLWGLLGMFLGFSFYMFWDLGEFALKRCTKSNVEAVGHELK